MQLALFSCPKNKRVEHFKFQLAACFSAYYLAFFIQTIILCILFVIFTFTHCLHNSRMNIYCAHTQLYTTSIYTHVYSLIYILHVYYMYICMHNEEYSIWRNEIYTARNNCGHFMHAYKSLWEMYQLHLQLIQCAIRANNPNIRILWILRPLFRHLELTNTDLL